MPGRTRLNNPEALVRTAEELYQELIAPIEQQMMRTVARIVGDPDDAADVFQQVLATVWKKLKRIHRHPNPPGYILRICVNASYDAIRRRARLRRREVPLEAATQTAPTTAARAVPEACEKKEAIMDAIAALPTKQAKAVLLRVVQELPYRAVGEVLGCSEATARSHVSKGTARLRLILSDL